jgi:pimeloyl-ACP methyl ester carboxylesterase
MPSFAANDGVNLHYETWGADTKPPLILVNLPHE